MFFFHHLFELYAFIWNITYLSVFQIEATFRKFDQTGNDKLNLQEFRDMMNKRAEAKSKKETLKKSEEEKTWKPPSEQLLFHLTYNQPDLI